MAQGAALEIRKAIIGIDNLAVRVLGQGVNGEVAAKQILLQGDVGRGIAGEAGIAKARFPFGARQGVLLPAFWVEEHREIAANLLVARVQHLLRGRTHNHPVFIFNR